MRHAQVDVSSGRHPTVGVVIPSYNAADFLPQAIESVLKQTAIIDDIVVVDDGSTDQTEDVVKRFTEDGVRYIKQANQGSAGARNTGVRSLSTDYICFLDTDDSWLPNKTTLQRDILMRRFEIGLVSGDQIFWDPERSIRKVRRFSGQPTRHLLRRKLALSNIVGNPSMVMVRRSIFEDVGLFDPSLRFGDDWDMWLRIAANSDIAFADEPVAVYRWHSKNQSRCHQTACLRAYRQISLRAIQASLSLSSRLAAYPLLIRHTPLYTGYRSLRYLIGTHCRRIQSALSHERT